MRVNKFRERLVCIHEDGSEQLTTREAAIRVSEYAFDYARKNGRKERSLI